MKKIAFMILLCLTAFSCTYKYTPVSSKIMNVTNHDLGDFSKLKKGEACIESVLGFNGFNNSTSVIDAMKDGKITKIKYIDSKYYVAPFYSKRCTVVYGL